jgi:NADH-quinone oxidoreductase subunit M
LIRFVLPIFPGVAREFGPVMVLLGVAGVLYGAFMAVAQQDLKRLVAYTSVSHMGFVLIGIFAGDRTALTGAFIQMISHGISTGALFILAGALQERMHTRELARMGGLWQTAPALSGAGLFFVMASVGVPGLGDFVGEFLVLLGAFHTHPVLTAFGTAGVIVSTLYGLRITSRVFYGPNSHNWRLPDLVPREALIAATMVVCLLWLGLYPKPFIRLFQGTSEKPLQSVASVEPLRR